MSTIHQSASKFKGKVKKNKLNALRSFFKCPQKKGIVWKCRIMAPKKPNSAKRKVARVRLSNKYFVTAKIKGKGAFLTKFISVLVCGGRANDLPGVRYNMIKGKYDFTWREAFWRMQSRSKYGIKWDDYTWIINEHFDKLEGPIDNEEK